MGLSSLAVVNSIIAQVYSIDVLLNSKYQQKFAIARLSQSIGLLKSRALSTQDPNARIRVRFLDLRDPSHPQPSEERFVNRGFSPFGFVLGGGGNFAPYDPSKAWNNQDLTELFTAYRSVNIDPKNNLGQWLSTLGAQGSVPVQNFDGTAANPGMEAIDENGQTLKPGEAYVDKETAEAMAEYYLKQLNVMEQQIDMELETLKAQRAALVQQREEFTKYVAEGIKTTFKNNYA